MIKAPSAKAVLRRIDKRIAALAVDGKKATDRAISLEATKSPDSLRSIRRNVIDGKQRGVSTETVEKFAAALKTSPEWLMTGNGPEHIHGGHIDSSEVLSDDVPAKRVRIVGYVGAGSTAHYYALSDTDYEEVDAPLSANDQTVAVEIKGTSFGPLLNSWLVFYDDVRSPVTEDLYGEVCVVGLADDRILIKQIHRERNGSFTLLSNTNEEPIRNAAIEWAAKVTDMRPRR